MKTTHKTKDGRVINISEMDNDHLLATYKNLLKIAEKGITRRSGGGYDPDDMWYDEQYYQGKQASEKLNIRAYMIELLKRDLLDLKEAVLYLLQ